MIICNQQIKGLLRGPLAIKHIAISGPSGCGKTTILRTDENSIIRLKPDSYEIAVSGATRPRRENEVDGLDYFFFKNREDFEKCIFLESNEYTANTKLYGTLYSEAERIIIRKKKAMLLDVDINGAMRLESIFKKELITVFLRTPLDMLRDRLLKRRITTGETDEQIESRIVTAKQEYKKVDDKIFIPKITLDYPDSIRPAEMVNKILFEVALLK